MLHLCNGIGKYDLENYKQIAVSWISKCHSFFCDISVSSIWYLFYCSFVSLTLHTNTPTVTGLVLIYNQLAGWCCQVAVWMAYVL